MFTTYLELAVSIFATTFVVVFLYTLITSALHKSCKFVFRQIHFEIRCYRVFLIMNGLGLLLLSTSHISVAVYRLMRPCAWLAQDSKQHFWHFFHNNLALPERFRCSSSKRSAIPSSTGLRHVHCLHVAHND